MIEDLLKQHRQLSPRPIQYDGMQIWCADVEPVRVTVSYPRLAELLRAYGLRQTGYGVTETWELT